MLYSGLTELRLLDFSKMGPQAIVSSPSLGPRVKCERLSWVYGMG